MISIFNPTKLDDIDSEFSVYPNPFVDNVNIYENKKEIMEDGVIDL